ncbi:MULTISPECIES: multicopper oxidase family protein [Rhodococcus]|uniref:Putative multicopper oxidase n=2 Tax=Rhodococcus opacus TaxID=37919 RepID=C1BCW4_RHOOB|nr:MULTISPECIES: multicopper oxidase family protein [Rhodococcus]EID81373.1 putative multicopper oxidase [Rhodococcus opacus RKJ300 = JCM 13270]KAF0958959.1 Multicopper oxidase MmcO [Rhodococcus sp. T7]QQZ19201.1 multicopper oxidase family protein [Rhodococcus sp. 21391]UOT07968.1 multicopper oxidase family protein [Rhodococcus opacus]BAH55708.1 putative multicopper oxidase [Rhodococcus opacus B4]
MIEQFPGAARLSRRNFLALAGLGAVAAAGACSRGGGPGPAPTAVGPDSAAVRTAEQVRRATIGTGNTVTASLKAGPTRIDLGGVQVDTWAYNDRIPGREVRLRRGDLLRAELTNDLPAESTIHWHGIALRNDMDGVPGLTQSAIAPTSPFTYEFLAPDAGTHWLHPHVGMQFDRGLYAPVIVEDPAEGGDYDLEAVLVLDDWLDGVGGRTPDQQLDELRQGGMPMMSGMGMDHGGMSGMDIGTTIDPANPLGADTGDVDYPYYLINGTLGTDPFSVRARPGQRVRLRIINAGADTAFRLAVGGHQLTVTHSDGYPMQPVTGSSVLIGMGERFDAIVTLGDGVFPIVAAAEGKQGQGFAVIRTGAGGRLDPAIRPAELDAPPITGLALRSREDVRLGLRNPDRVHDLMLGMDMSGYRWTINGATYDEHTPLAIAQGQRVRLRFVNQTMMFHPMHLHGHTFQVVDGHGTGPRKDTTLVLPNQTVEVDLDADNPGQWLVHCHNLYHGEAGMMTTLSYTE